MWQVIALSMIGFVAGERSAGASRGNGQGEGKVTVSNVRATLCPLGPPRTESTYLPGDVVHVTFNVSGLKLDEEGRYRVAGRLVVEDAAGKAVATEEFGASPARLGVLAGGRTRFAFRYVIPLEAQPASYKAKLQLIDVVGQEEAAKAKGVRSPELDPNRQATVEQAFRVAPPSFGLIRLVVGRGPFGQAETPCVGVVGEILFVGAAAVGLGKGQDGTAHLDVRVEIQDGQGKVLGKPQLSDFKNVSATDPFLLKFELPLDQVGKYQVVFRATDKASSPPRSATLTVPLTVVE